MCRADAKAGLSEPTLARRSGEDHQIKATPGITGWYRPSVHSDGGVRHLKEEIGVLQERSCTWNPPKI